MEGRSQLHLFEQTLIKYQFQQMSGGINNQFNIQPNASVRTSQTSLFAYRPNPPVQQSLFGHQPSLDFYGQLPQYTVQGQKVSAYHVHQLLSILSKAQQFHSQDDVSRLMLLLWVHSGHQAKLMESIIQNKMNSERKQQEIDYNRQRCKAINRKNNNLLSRVMNLRLKLVKNNNLYINNKVEREQEIELINDKIKRAQFSIMEKYNKLRIIRMQKTKMVPEENKEEVSKFVEEMPLEQLKRAMELLEKQAIKFQQQLNLIRASLDQTI